MYVIPADTDLISRFLAKYERPNTIRNYRYHLTRFFGMESVTMKEVAAVTSEHINKEIEKAENAFAPATVEGFVTATSIFFDWLCAMDVIRKNPANKHLIRKRRRENRAQRKIFALSKEESRRLLDATLVDPRHDRSNTSKRNHAIVLTLLNCLLRRSEIGAMDVKHIRNLYGYWVIDLPETKGGANQFVKIPVHVMETIQEMQKFYGIESGPLWRSMEGPTKGSRLSTRQICNIVKQAAKRAGLPHEISTHTLRHTGCTLALEAGATLHQVQIHARHKSINTTLRYIHQRDKLSNSAADFINI